MQGRRLGAYVACLFALSALLAASSLMAPKATSPGPLWVIAAMGAILLVLSLSPFRSYGTIFSFIGPVVIPILYFASPLAAGLLISFGSISASEFKKKQLRGTKFLFNRLNLFIAGYCAAFVFHVLSGIGPETLKIFWLLCAATTYYLINHTLFWFGAWLLGGSVPVFYSFVLPTLIKTNPISTILGVLFIQSIESFGLAGIIVFLILLITLNREASASLVNAKAFHQTVEAFVETLEAKDRYTRGHSERVAELVQEIAAEMKLPKRVAKTCYQAAKLHDIGKIGVVEGILNKEKHLTRDEFEIVKQHPETGARIVSRVDALTEFSPIIRYHHERWDGRGYPEGLTGEAIPVGARIIAVADTFDAITSDRPYRRALSHSAAIAELQACAETQFDSNVVMAAVRVLSRRQPEATLQAQVPGTGSVHIPGLGAARLEAAVAAESIPPFTSPQKPPAREAAKGTRTKTARPTTEEN